MSKLFNKQVLKEFKLSNFIGLTIAGVVNAVGVTMFLAPIQLFDSGASGTAMLISNFTANTFLSLSVLLIIINIPFYIIGLKKQGLVFTVYSIYAIALYSMFAYLFQHVFPIDFSGGSPIVGTDKLLCAVFGGIISGLGSGLTIRFGGAIDGIEVMAVVFAKYLGLTVGSFVMMYNAVLYIIGGAVLGSWTLPLYSVITYMVGLKAVDFVVEGFDRAKAAMIITNRRDAVADIISKNLGRGITIMNAQGYYSKEEKAVIYVVVNRFQIGKLKKLVASVDAKAFVTITVVADTFGQSKKLANYNAAHKKIKLKLKASSPKNFTGNVEHIEQKKEIHTMHFDKDETDKS